MNYRDAWQSFAALINGIKEAAFLHSQFMQSPNLGTSSVALRQLLQRRSERFSGESNFML